MKHSRRLTTAIRAALLGITLAAATAACQPTDSGGTESTADVCTDLDDNVPMLVASIESSPLQLGFYPDPISATDRAHILDVTHGNYGELSGALRGEADTAADPATVTALSDTADTVDRRAASITTIDDVAGIDDTNAVDISQLYPVCPGLALDEKSG